MGQGNRALQFALASAKSLDPPTDFQVNNLAHDKVTVTWRKSAGGASYEVDNGFG